MPLLDIGEIRIYYEEHDPHTGATPLVFLHGWTADHSVWLPQMGYFSKTRRVILLDHRGHGSSDTPKGDYSIETFAADLKSVLEKLGVRKCILAGHSMGGMIAQRFTIDNPEIVEKLILVGTTAKIVDSAGMRLLTSLNGFLLHVAFRVAIRINTAQAYRKGTPKEIIMNRYGQALKTSPYAVRKAYSYFVKKFDTRAELSKIKVPTLVIAGTSDRMLQPGMSEYLQKNIDGAKIALIGGAGHMVIEEEAEKVNEAVAGFI